MIETCQTEKAKRDYMLLRKALDDNDQQAYAELMSLYRDSIYYMLVRMVKNKDDAEDLTLMTFGKAFRYLDKYTPKYAFSTWLYRIALNNSIDFLRMKNNMPQYFEEDLYTSSTTSIIDQSEDNLQRNPEEEIIDKQRLQLLRAAVSELPERYRRVIELRYYEDLAYEEIAERLGLTLSNVKIQIMRAKQMLSELMKPMRNAM
ncbi:MAG: sigma-70 family RNA polymerase sigma factor [Bacteroidales bacterium]|jgi:RNA polymerase sigma-70 factor (ECF subfamily)|nr:sigma-70 family RNA polymerase sigma factor [Bacteroidales bacterium]MBR5259376.1 sigma-70 family RNA polymerase sigma factor [Eggerthellaceae bacterium]MBR4637841.1 sigma-70 family RNA polymerase sigma factor [Bacteroidales bacterium]MBR5921163.1 sigma-70 family RNA polymerase sigma factor [Bacteroidales bacterium]MBR6174307.1 sigma-70 family RNA polymerase sigma factor [Bacteroidales bacterium]